MQSWFSVVLPDFLVEFVFNDNFDTKLAKLLFRSNWLNSFSTQLAECVDVTMLFLTDFGTGRKRILMKRDRDRETEIERQR